MENKNNPQKEWAHKKNVKLFIALLVAGATLGLSTFLMLIGSFCTDPVSKNIVISKELVTVITFVVMGLGIIGGFLFIPPNPPKS
jgi:uncharacterized BrkB/YihY/UPF0761 family membrane protein